jgi:hypothetical protein
MMESARKTWKQLTLMEDAMLIHRIMRAPSKRVYKIDIGNIPPNEVDNYMQRIINKMKKTPFLDENTGEYNLKYNIQNLTEDFFLPVRGGDSGTEINELGGLDYDSTDDIEYLKNKMLASLRVPKAFLGFDENVGGKATLAAEDVRFARTIERIQRIVISELTKIAVVHLYSQGYTDEELVNFDLELTNPSTMYDQEKVELWSSKVSLARDMVSDKILPTEWVYDNIFNFSDEEKDIVRKQIIDDQKDKFRHEQIEQEGNDPKESGESVGTPSDMQSGGGFDEDSSSGSVFDDKGGSPEGGFEGAGRPKEANKYGKESGARGRNPLGQEDRKPRNKKSKFTSPLALAHYDALKKSMGSRATELISEEKKIDEVSKEYNEYKEDKTKK